jgi:hypothetical protein
MGDHGQAGGIGDRGIPGPQGVMGETGDTGVRGGKGEPGDTGSRGGKGDKGDRGRSLTWWQAIAMFFIVLVVAVVLSYRNELQQRKIEQQQREIAANAQHIAEARYQGCLGGVAILDRFNKQMEALAQIERDLTVKASPAGKRIGTARIKAYEEGEIIPLPVCTR